MAFYILQKYNSSWFLFSDLNGKSSLLIQGTFILPILILIQKNAPAVTHIGEASYPVTVSSLHMKREILLICCQEMRFALNKAMWQAECNHMNKKEKKKKMKACMLEKYITPSIFILA